MILLNKMIVHNQEVNMIKVMTICFLIKGEGQSKTVCLAEKKRGYRVGKINGYGGKQEEGETLEECAIRETIEESGVIPKSIQKHAEIRFYDPELTHECHVYVINEWEGEVVETEEMRPEWHAINAIPFDRMGQADPLWIPQVLQGKRVKAEFFYDAENIMHETTVEEVEGFLAG